MRTDVPNLHGARVTVMGLGLFGAGVGVTKFLCRAGAHVTVTDLNDAERLRESVSELSGWPVEFQLGQHREEDFQSADLVVVSPAVPEDSPWLRFAHELDTEMNLFAKLCPARTIYGITGSNGKTTTTTLVGEILRRGPRRVWVGGNLGVSLLEVIDEISPDDIVVLELSSFQLQHLDSIGWSPQVSVVLNITPNHLDRHGSVERYVDAKRAIVRHQGEHDLRILNADDPTVRTFAGARTRWFGHDAPPEGTRVLPERIEHGGRVLDVRGRRLPGAFNLYNMAAATAAVAESFPGWTKAAGDVLISFAGVEHRLEFVAESGGVAYYDDSIATTPERTLAALDTLSGPIVLLLGGYDKGLSFTELGAKVRERCREVVLFGQTADALEDAIRTGGAGGADASVRRATSFEEAVAMARTAARPGDNVLLSPACASYGMFRNFTERGRRFKELVRAA